MIERRGLQPIGLHAPPVVRGSKRLEVRPRYLARRAAGWRVVAYLGGCAVLGARH
jgi:hypothetical protein